MHSSAEKYMISLGLFVSRMVVSLFAIFHAGCVGRMKVSPMRSFMTNVFLYTFLWVQKTKQNPDNMKRMIIFSKV